MPTEKRHRNEPAEEAKKRRKMAMETTTLKQVLSFTTKLDSLTGDFVQFTKELERLQDIHGWDDSLTFKIFNTKWISNQFVDLDEIHSLEDLYSLRNIFGDSRPSQPSGSDKTKRRSGKPPRNRCG